MRVDAAKRVPMVTTALPTAKVRAVPRLTAERHQPQVTVRACER